MTKPQYTSSSFVTFSAKQRIMYGFQMDMTFQLQFMSQQCDNYQCRSRFGQGFAIIIHNSDPA